MICFLAEQQNFQLSLAEELLSCYNVAFPRLTFLLEMAFGGLHIASPTSIYYMDVHVVVLSTGSLPAAACPCHGEWILVFPARLPVPACFVHKAGVILARGEAGMC